MAMSKRGEFLPRAGDDEGALAAADLDGQAETRTKRSSWSPGPPA